MNSKTTDSGRVLCLRAAARRFQIPERTLRYRASRGRIQGSYKEGKLWRFPLWSLPPAQKEMEIEMEIVKNDR